MSITSFFQNLSHLTVIGTNYTKADSQTRSRFALSQKEIEKIYIKAHNKGLGDFFILSTCNRIEFYGCAPVEIIRALILDAMDIHTQEMGTYFYTHTALNAVRHFFRVTTGLDSQIIGDYEIVGQVKKAIHLSRHSGLIGTLMDRISNYAFQASKEVKSKTNISTGKYSVSYAAAELINAQKTDCPFKNILIVGTGEIGQAMARNLKDYFPQSQLSLTNRTLSHVQNLAQELKTEIIPFEKFTDHLYKFDAVITAVESDHYLICGQDLPQNISCLFLDLSIPQVIDPQIKHLPGISYYSVDEISTFHNDLIKKRHLDIPKADLIIEDFIFKLVQWQNVFRHTGIINNYKEKMGRIINYDGNPTAKIEKSFSGLIQQIKSEGYRGCSLIQTMNELIALEK